MQANQQPNKPAIIRRATVQQRFAAAVVFAVVAASFGLLGLAAQHKIDIARLLGPCGFKQRYGLPCPTCGMTTAALTFAKGEVLEAFYIQPAAALLCCAMLVIGFLALPIALFGVYFGFIERFLMKVKVRHIILILILIIAAGWTVTLTRALTRNIQP